MGCLALASNCLILILLTHEICCMTYRGRIRPQKLLLGDKIMSETGDNTYLKLQSDGNLVLFNDENILWSTNTKRSRYAWLHSNGNLCIYQSFYYKKAKWCSKSSGHREPQLVVENACAFIINGDGKRIWNTGTAGCRWPKVPCIKGEENKPVGCAKRILSCEEIDEKYKDMDISDANRIGSDENTKCYETESKQRLQNTVDEKEKKENTYIVKFDDKNGNCFGIKMYGGECWGEHPETKNNYDCMGRCGAGCGTWTCSNWGRDCMKHDVCGWYLSSTKGYKDEDCKDEFWHAYNDWYGQQN